MSTPHATQNGNDKKAATPTAVAATAAAAATAAKKDAAVTGDKKEEKEEKDGEGEEAKTRNSSKVYLAYGPVKEFKNKAEAEKFVNTPESDALGTFTAIRGFAIEGKRKVSFR